MKKIKPPLTPQQSHSIIKAIDDLVQTDFCYDMTNKTRPQQKPYTQAEARKMAYLLAKIYMHAHKISCTACRRDLLV